jgi:hypothetical protein
MQIDEHARSLNVTLAPLAHRRHNNPAQIQPYEF